MSSTAGDQEMGGLWLQQQKTWIISRTAISYHPKMYSLNKTLFWISISSFIVVRCWSRCEGYNVNWNLNVFIGFYFLGLVRASVKRTSGREGVWNMTKIFRAIFSWISVKGPPRCRWGVVAMSDKLFCHVLPHWVLPQCQSATTVFLHLQCAIPAKSLLCGCLQFKHSVSYGSIPQKKRNNFEQFLAATKMILCIQRLHAAQCTWRGSPITFAPLWISGWWAPTLPCTAEPWMSTPGFFFYSRADMLWLE